MPLTYIILPEENLVSVKGTGVVDYDQLVDHLESLAADPQYQAPMKKLVDYRSLSVLALSKTETLKFNEIKEQYRHIFDGERCAVVSEKDLTFRTTRDHSKQIDAQIALTRVFKDISSALKWLKLEHIREDQLLL